MHQNDAFGRQTRFQVACNCGWKMLMNPLDNCCSSQHAILQRLLCLSGCLALLKACTQCSCAACLNVCKWVPFAACNFLLRAHGCSYAALPVVRHVCTCFYMFACLYIFAHGCSYIAMPAVRHVCTCLHMFVHICTYLYMFVHVCTCLHMGALVLLCLQCDMFPPGNIEKAAHRW